jgi:hypothetical protein
MDQKQIKNIFEVYILNDSKISIPEETRNQKY